MKGLFARIWYQAGPGLKFLGCLVVAFAAFVGWAVIGPALTAPPRLRPGQEVVLLDREGAHHLVPVPDPVCVLAQHPREALFVVEWTRGTVLADDGSIWAIDRNVKVRLEGPSVLGKGYRDGQKYHTYLMGERLDVEVGRSYVVDLIEAVERRKDRQ